MNRDRDPNYGRLLGNRYQLAELLGEGAMGQVYRARDNILGGVRVAVKFLSQTLLNQSMRDRFEREATISALLGEKSNHVVRVKDYGVDEKQIPYYVMEYLSGQNLNEIIRHKPLNWYRFLKLARHICLGLESAHQGISFNGELCQIIHRDIKPSNIIVIQDPTIGELAKILDFGIAKLILSDDSQTRSFMGTLAYCSPEQMEGQELDPRADIYSLGVLMYEILTQQMPLLPQNSSFGGWYKAHQEFKPRKLDPHLNVPLELETLVLKCLSKKKENRPQSMGEIIDILENLIEINNFQNTENTQPEINILSSTKTRQKSLKEVCLSLTWPPNKPKQKIVFPKLINYNNSKTAALLVMLEEEDIQKRKSCIRYNQFLFLNNPYPLLLWLTLLYNTEYGPRWLPCYLDLKSEKGQNISRILAKNGRYPIAFFSLENPGKCQHVANSKIEEKTCYTIEKWLDSSKKIETNSTPQAAKKILKEEVDKLKNKILRKIESLTQTDRSTISN